MNEIKTEESGRKMMTTVSGPEYFGLAAPEIRKLIQVCPYRRHRRMIGNANARAATVCGC